MTQIQKLLQNSKTQFDLTEEADQNSLNSLIEMLLDTNISMDQLQDISRAEEAPIEFKIAAKVVESRRYISSIDKPLKIAVVFAMWGEQNRLHPKSENNPNGEDSLRVKLAQLEGATQGSPLDWTLYAVDDGCPHHSGGIAAEIAASHPLGDHVEVLFLSNAVPTDTGPLAALASVDDSRKGGAIIYGCMKAIEDGADVIIYTDADNSVHLGQIGLILRPYIDDGVRVVLGNRKHPDAVLVKAEDRWGIGIKVLRHIQRMIGKAIFSQDIQDTQAALKLYERGILTKIISDPSVYDFSFDTDWILATIAADEPFSKIPFAFIDSAAESASITQGPMTTWETLLKGLTKAVRKRGVDHNEGMAKVLDEEIHSSVDLDILINHLPPQLEAAIDDQLGDPGIMSPTEVQTWIQMRKREHAAR